MTPLLEVENLSIGVKRGTEYLPAVDEVCFQLYPGEILGIVGESGCGKTLTVRAVPGLLPQGVRIAGGNIRFNGTDMRRISKKELRRIRGRDLTMIFQEQMTALNPLLKIGRQIGEPLALHGEKDKPLIYAKTLDCMRKTGLPEPEKLVSAYPHQLSGGMRQRALIAAAVISGPKLLIADEPTSALDVTIQAQILRLLKTLNRELGTAMLFISHDLEVISRLCDRALVMYAGRFVEAGDVQDLFTNPRHEYTKGLIGSIPSRERKGTPLTAIPGKAPAVEEKKREGCPFAPRCRRAEAFCFISFPAKTLLTDRRYVHCRLAEAD